MTSFIQWASIYIELIGLTFITIELYFPTLSDRLRTAFERTKPKVIRNSKLWIGGYIVAWVVAVLIATLWDTSMSLYANVIFTLITVLLLFIHGISKLAIRLGVILGKGNAVGGVGLVTAIFGLILEIVPLLGMLD